MELSTFLQQAKANAEKKAAEMARLELSIWDGNHEKELKDHFGFNDKALRKRKSDLKEQGGGL